jgi:methyl-accepting chemotaxis protein
MPFLAKLVRSVLLSIGLAGGVAWLLAERTFDLPPEPLRWVRVAAIAGLLSGGLALFLLALRWSRPLLRVVAAAGKVAEPEKLAAALAGARLPARVGGSALVLGIATTAAATALLGRAGVPGDLLTAGAGLGVAGALLAGLVAHAATASAASEAVDSLGPRADFGVRGTLRGRVLVFALGLDTVAVLLFAASGYARHRADTLRATLADTWRGQTAAIALGHAGPELARTVWLATGAATALVAPGGGGMDLAGGALPPGRETGPSGTEVVADPPGWLVRSRIPGGGDLVSWIPEARLRDRWAAFWRQLAPVGALVWAAGAILAWAASRAASVPLRGLGRAAGRMAAGDLTVDPPAVSRDDVGRLAAEFRRIAQGLRAIVADVHAASEGIAMGAREAATIDARVRGGALGQHSTLEAMWSAVQAMEGSAADVSGGVGGLADQLGAVSAEVGDSLTALEEIQAKGAELRRAAQAALRDVDALADWGREADASLAGMGAATIRAGETLSAVKASLATLERAADESESNAGLVADVAQRAGGVVEETVHGIEAVRAAVSDAHRRIAALGRRSDDVAQVVDFIAEVAGRTNLLSLNASIIASQAGEHGKAFAVVADQIRELAAQIARSTRSIGDIIHAVREEVGATASLIDRGDALASEGVQLARNSLEALAGIQRSAQQGKAIAAAVGAAVGAHGTVARDVAAVVESVTDGSRAVAASVQLVGRGVTGVGTVSRNLESAVEEVARVLEERAGAGRRHLESFARVEQTIGEVARAAEAQVAATRRLREALQSLSDAAGQHETAVDELSRFAERLGSGAKQLSDSVGRFRI